MGYETEEFVKVLGELTEPYNSLIIMYKFVIRDGVENTHLFYHHFF